jgi:hypothetical protein
MLSLGVQTLLPKVTYEEMEELEGFLRKPGDRREGQLLANYDRVYKEIKIGIEEFALPLPRLFQMDYIDRTSATFFNTSTEEEMRVEKVGRSLISVLRTERIKYLVEHGQSVFKVKLSDKGNKPSMACDQFYFIFGLILRMISLIEPITSLTHSRTDTLTN